MLNFKRGKRWYASQRKILRDNFKLGFNSTYVLMMMFVWILGIYYVWTLNLNATNGFVLKKLEVENKSLRVEKELLEVRVAELESLNYIANSPVTADMFKAEKPEYFVLKWNKAYAYTWE